MTPTYVRQRDRARVHPAEIYERVKECCAGFESAYAVKKLVTVPNVAIRNANTPFAVALHPVIELLIYSFRSSDFSYSTS
jgi:hypothetical protein